MEKSTPSIIEYLSSKDTINVGSDEESGNGFLSNFAESPFILDGKTYTSVEGFWQALYFPEGSTIRDEVASLSGREAKFAGRKKEKDIQNVTYEGREIKIGSDEHHALMEQALLAKFEQNHHIQDILLATGNKRITHIVKSKEGNIHPDSKSIPGEKFSQILMNIRQQLREKQT